MKLSNDSLEVLREVIIKSLNYHSKSSRRLSDEEMTDKLMNFFLDINEGGQLDAPTTGSYARGMLRQHNGTDFIKKAVEKVLAPKLLYPELGGGRGPYGASNEIQFHKMLVPMLDLEDYKLVIVRKTIGNSRIDGIHYRILDENEFAETPAMEENKKVQDIITKAKERFTREDYEGAITSSFNLAETVIKNKLDELGISYKGKPQFVDCYPLLAKELNLNPAGENIESYLQQILQGLESQMKGLYHLGNKAGDRHTPKHPPKRQDAKLAMNAAFTLCEYLSDTHKSRQAQ